MAKRPAPAVGSIVKMIGTMEGDPNPIPVGTTGTVQFVNDMGDWYQVDVDWENGRSLMLLDTDSFTVVR